MCALGSLSPLFIIEFSILKTVVFGGQDSIEFFNEGEEFVSILFYGDQRAQFVNAITVGFVHRAAITAFAGGGSMFDVERYRETRK